jgi:hypothetical protein
LYELIIGGKGIRKLSGAPEQLFEDLPAVGFGKRLKGLQQMTGCVSHGSLFYAA